MTSAPEQLSKEWRQALESIERRRASPILLPLALLAICRLYEREQAQNDVISFDEYETAFKDLSREKHIVTKSGAWMPYTALAGQIGILECLASTDGAPCSLGGSTRPKSRASLMRVSTSARVLRELNSELRSAACRAMLIDWAQSRIAGFAPS